MRAAECGFQSWAVHLPGVGQYKARRLSRDDELSPEAARFGTGETPGIGELVAEG